MRIFQGFDALPTFRAPVATVGSYDGVHGGHKKLLDRVVRTAHDEDGESIVLTFDPHPRVTLGCAEGLCLLTSTREKALLLERAGIDNMIIIPFDATFSRLAPDEFVRDHLIDRIGVQTLVVGYNHHFGRNKLGDYDFLDRLHHECGFRVERVAEYDSDSQKVSSTVLRSLIGCGKMERAAQIMSHPYLIVGRAQGYNVHIDEPLKLLPPPGNYAVRINGEQEVCLKITADQMLVSNKALPSGEVVITF